eukprot:2065854-Rhodomonas_salina.1
MVRDDHLVRAAKNRTLAAAQTRSRAQPTPSTPSTSTGRSATRESAGTVGDVDGDDDDDDDDDDDGAVNPGERRLGDEGRRREGAGARSARPNVLIVELDSVSAAYADRHFPRTRALLARLQHQPPRAAPGSGASEAGAGGLGTVVVDFGLANSVGTASIVNAFALLSGCVGAWTGASGPFEQTPLRAEEVRVTPGEKLVQLGLSPLPPVSLLPVPLPIRQWCPAEAEGGEAARRRMAMKEEGEGIRGV